MLSQGCTGKIDLVPSTRALEPLLVEDGHTVQRGAVVVEVRGALAAEGEIVFEREKRSGEVSGVLCHQVGDGLQGGQAGRRPLIARPCEMGEKLVPVREKGPPLQCRLGLAADAEI